MKHLFCKKHLKKNDDQKKKKKKKRDMNNIDEQNTISMNMVYKCMPQSEILVCFQNKYK